MRMVNLTKKQKMERMDRRAKRRNALKMRKVQIRNEYEVKIRSIQVLTAQKINLLKEEIESINKEALEAITLLEKERDEVFSQVEHHAKK